MKEVLTPDEIKQVKAVGFRVGSINSVCGKHVFIIQKLMYGYPDNIERLKKDPSMEYNLYS